MSDAYFKTGVIKDSIDLFNSEMGKYYSVGGWTGFFNGTKITDEDLFSDNNGKYYPVGGWTGFYIGSKKSLIFTKR